MSDIIQTHLSLEGLKRFIEESFQQGKKIYSIELIELGRLEGKVTELKSNFTSNPATSLPYQ